LSVFRSNRHIHAQLIDDSVGRTVAAAGTQQSDLAKTLSDSCGSNIAAAKLVGKAIAAQALANGLSQVCFDRGCYRYHGRVKALADAAREAGLKF
jgi:large subunit ribosomal protein L18